MSIANELITRGWRQNVLEDVDGRVCLSGALNAAVLGQPHQTFNTDNEAKAIMRARSLVKALCGGTCIEAWNDSHFRTFDEVLRVAKEADELLGAS